jgi:hypothetical protein
MAPSKGVLFLINQVFSKPKQQRKYSGNTAPRPNRIPQIFPKKVTELHTIKKGASPFHFVGFTESFGQMSNKYKGLGKRDPDPNPFLVLVL